MKNLTRLINSVTKVFKLDEIVTDSIGMELIEIPAGSFTIGSPDDEKDHQGEEAQASVTLTKPFGLGKYEVTQGQWKKVMRSDRQRVWMGCHRVLRKTDEVGT